MSAILVSTSEPFKDIQIISTTVIGRNRNGITSINISHSHFQIERKQNLDRSFSFYLTNFFGKKKYNLTYINSKLLDGKELPVKVELFDNDLISLCVRNNNTEELKKKYPVYRFRVLTKTGVFSNQIKNEKLQQTQVPFVQPNYQITGNQGYIPQYLSQQQIGAGFNQQYPMQNVGLSQQMYVNPAFQQIPNYQMYPIQQNIGQFVQQPYYGMQQIPVGVNTPVQQIPVGVNTPVMQTGQYFGQMFPQQIVQQEKEKQKKENVKKVDLGKSKVVIVDKNLNKKTQVGKQIGNKLNKKTQVGKQIGNNLVQKNKRRETQSRNLNKNTKKKQQLIGKKRKIPELPPLDDPPDPPKKKRKYSKKKHKSIYNITPPKKPQSSYLIFYIEKIKQYKNKPGFKKENGKLNTGLIQKDIGKKWRSLDETQKKKYTEGYEKQKVEYEKKVKIYNEKCIQQAKIPIPGNFIKQKTVENIGPNIKEIEIDDKKSSLDSQVTQRFLSQDSQQELLKKSLNPNYVVEKGDLFISLGKSMRCELCNEILDDPIIAIPCSHKFCSSCLLEYKNGIDTYFVDCKKCSKVIHGIARNEKVIKTASIIRSRSIVKKTVLLREKFSEQYLKDIKDGKTAFVNEKNKDKVKCLQCKYGLYGNTNVVKCGANDDHELCGGCKKMFVPTKDGNINPWRPKKCEYCEKNFCRKYFQNPFCNVDLKRLCQHKIDYFVDPIPKPLDGFRFRLNQIERYIVIHYMTHHKLSPNNVFHQCLDRLRRNEINLWKKGNITAESFVCEPCANVIFHELLFHFRRFLPNKEIPPEFRNRENCWWGVNCKTQFDPRNAKHCRTKNHICRPHDDKEVIDLTKKQ